jgi:hypothetical protein
LGAYLASQVFKVLFPCLLVISAAVEESEESLMASFSLDAQRIMCFEVQKLRPGLTFSFCIEFFQNIIFGKIILKSASSALSPSQGYCIKSVNISAS